MNELLQEAFAIGSYSISWWQLLVASIVPIGLVWLVAKVRKTHKSLDFYTESDLICKVLNDAWKKCGGKTDNISQYVEDSCTKHFASVEGKLYYEWHDGRKLRIIGPLNREKFALLAIVGKTMSQGDKWRCECPSGKGEISCYPLEAQVLRYLSFFMYRRYMGFTKCA